MSQKIDNYERFLYDYEERLAIMLENGASTKEAAWVACREVSKNIEQQGFPLKLAVAIAFKMRQETLKNA